MMVREIKNIKLMDGQIALPTFIYPDFGSKQKFKKGLN
jgi:hypothetical protein